MNNKISWYFEQKNSLLGNNILAICYNASDKEIKENNLTNNTILILIKHEKFDEYINVKDFDLKKCLNDSFKDKIFMRIQCECLLGMYGDLHCDCEQQRNEALKLLREKNGIFIHLPQEAQGHGLQYKLKELELQVNGRENSGKYIGHKDRNEAQKILLQNEKFEDKRAYTIIKHIICELGLYEKEFVLLTDSNKKITELQQSGIKVEIYKDYINNSVNIENVSEYLVKILEETHIYDKNVLKEIMRLIRNRDYNERTINTFLKIIEKIDTNSINLNEEAKEMFLETYNSKICGIEKVYNFVDTNLIKVQNKFSCKVNNRIFGVLKLVFNENIFNRISFEQSYFFNNKKENYYVRIRDSEVLGIKKESSLFLNGQEYLQQTTFLNGKTKLIENEITKSNLRVYFENKEFIYIKKIDMITFISENELDGVNVYIKRMPNIENHIMDVYGKKESILKFIKKITNVSDKTMLSMISNIQLEEDDYDYNLSFADEKAAIDEEIAIFNLLNEEDK